MEIREVPPKRYQYTPASEESSEMMDDLEDVDDEHSYKLLDLDKLPYGILDSKKSEFSNDDFNNKGDGISDSSKKTADNHDEEESDENDDVESEYDSADGIIIGNKYLM
ncbi:unnamed protein product [Thelazia callipaeda]|uniref:TBP-binding domain-containing protein n=1 Tax=Thelazia callipaeda TaxID=103827 RepID=A0A0N5DAX2_THECL|nr:unnamed protein product [Thelazia callipaeda]